MDSVPGMDLCKAIELLVSMEDELVRKGLSSL